MPRRPARPRAASPSPSGPGSGWSSGPSSWYLDLNLLSRYVNDRRAGHGLPPHGTGDHGGGAARRPRVRCSTRVSSAAWARHAECGRLLQDGLGRPRPRALWPPTTACPQLTTVRMPDRRRRRRGPPAAALGATASRSAPGPASWPGRSGASAAWATRRGGGTSSPCSAP